MCVGQWPAVQECNMITCEIHDNYKILYPTCSVCFLPCTERESSGDKHNRRSSHDQDFRGDSGGGVGASSYLQCWLVQPM